MTTYKTLRLTTFVTLMAVLSACSDDNSNGPLPTGQITVAVNTTTTAANDLRGVTFARNGKIYASGHTDATASDRSLVVARFNADGTPDTSFGGDGTVEINVAVGGTEDSSAVVELANGDLIVAANVSDLNGGETITSTENPAVTAPRQEGISVVLLRLSSTGNLVSSFGTAGKVEVKFGWTNAENGSWPVPTLNSAGTFSHPGFPRDTAYDIRLDNTGEKVVVFGFGPAAKVASGTQRLDNDRYVTRVVASTGAIDTAFNSGAPFTFSTAGALGDNARRGVVEADGKIMSSGYTNLGTGLGNHIVLIKLTAAGTLDSSFQGFGTEPVQNGVAVFNPFKVDGGVAECYAAIAQSNGKYVTTGYGQATATGTASTLGYQSSTAPDVVSFRVANGAVDTTYGNSGTQAIQSEGKGRATTEDRGRDMVVLADDRMVQVGRFGGTAAVYVFKANGVLDTTVDTDGIIELPNSTIPAQFFAAALSPDGRRVAVTTNNDAAGARLVVLNADL